MSEKCETCGAPKDIDWRWQKAVLEAYALRADQLFKAIDEVGNLYVDWNEGKLSDREYIDISHEILEKSLNKIVE